MNIPIGTKLINYNGEVKTVARTSDGFVNFNGGGGCNRSNLRLYYSDCDIVRPGECKDWISGDDRTMTVDNR